MREVIEHSIKIILFLQIIGLDIDLSKIRPKEKEKKNGPKEIFPSGDLIRVN